MGCTVSLEVNVGEKTPPNNGVNRSAAREFLVVPSGARCRARLRPALDARCENALQMQNKSYLGSEIQMVSNSRF